MARQQGKQTKRTGTVIALSLFCVFLFAVLFLAYFVRTKRLLLNERLLGSKAVSGVDLSDYQGEVDMQHLQEQGVAFVYIKATEGSGYVDPHFAKNWAGAGKTAMARGAYHFFSFDSSAKTQAENYISTVGDLKGCLIPVVDVEYYGNRKQGVEDRTQAVENLLELLSLLEQEYGVKPMVYVTREMYAHLLKGAVEGYPLWVRSVYVPPFFYGWSRRDWTVWQYSDRGRLQGYSGGERFIDLDVLNPAVSLEGLKVQ